MPVKARIGVFNQLLQIGRYMGLTCSLFLSRSLPPLSLSLSLSLPPLSLSQRVLLLASLRSLCPLTSLTSYRTHLTLTWLPHPFLGLVQRVHEPSTVCLSVSQFSYFLSLVFSVFFCIKLA